MKNKYIVGIIIGFLVIFFAVPMGFSCGDSILQLSGSMNTNSFMIMQEKFITSFQIIGGMISGLSGIAWIFSNKKLQATNSDL